MQQKGYISGETLADFDHNHVVVLSTWSSHDAWENWVRSEERNALEKGLTDYLGESAKIRAFISSADYVSKALEQR
jgi:heme-degrading monooxygenase HmoA